MHGDIRCLEDLTPFTGSTDLILECSAEPSAQAGYGGSPEYLVQTNLIGCFHCLEIARRNRADEKFDEANGAGVKATIEPNGMKLEMRCIDPKHKAHGEKHDLKWRT